MTYTKTQLVAAYCRAKGFVATAEKTKTQFIAEEKVKAQEAHQLMMERFRNPLRNMKQVAIKQLQNELAEEADSVSLE